VIEGQDGRVVDDLAFAQRLADLADEISRAEFESRSYAVRIKDDGSAVTDVGVRVEEAIAMEVASAHPKDGFLSEELGRRTTRRGTRRRWIVDGIDGTRAFIEGGVSWGTLIALEQDGEAKLGVASSPGLQRRWWGSRRGGSWTATLDASGLGPDPDRLSVSISGLRPRGVVLPPLGLLDGWRDKAVLVATGLLRSPGTDGHGRSWWLPARLRPRFTFGRALGPRAVRGSGRGGWRQVHRPLGRTTDRHGHCDLLGRRCARVLDESLESSRTG
jgi:hypothetical protein